MNAPAARSVAGSMRVGHSSMYSNVRPPSPGRMKCIGIFFLSGAVGTVGQRGGGTELRNQSVQDARADLGLADVAALVGQGTHFQGWAYAARRDSRGRSGSLRPTRPRRPQPVPTSAWWAFRGSAEVIPVGSERRGLRPSTPAEIDSPQAFPDPEPTATLRVANRGAQRQMRNCRSKDPPQCFDDVVRRFRSLLNASLDIGNGLVAEERAALGRHHRGHLRVRRAGGGLWPLTARCLPGHSPMRST